MRGETDVARPQRDVDPGLAQPFAKLVVSLRILGADDDDRGSLFGLRRADEALAAAVEGGDQLLDERLIVAGMPR